MRRLSIENKLFFSFLFLLLTLGISSVAQAQGQSPNIWLKPNTTGNALEGMVEENAQKNSCLAADTVNDNTSEIGYFCFKKGNNGMVKINILPIYPCGENPGYRWEISQIVAGGEGVRNKADVTWGELSKGAAEDIGAIAQTGVITINPAGGGPTAHFKNDNKHEVVIWYRVDAACKKGTETDLAAGTISFDPRGRNGGTN